VLVVQSGPQCPAACFGATDVGTQRTRATSAQQRTRDRAEDSIGTCHAVGGLDRSGSADILRCAAPEEGFGAGRE